jgi:hypothetical protein
VKLKVIALALFIAGAGASYAVAGGSHPDKGKPTTAASTTSSTSSTETETTKGKGSATDKKVTLCHKAGKSGKWVKITVSKSSVKAHEKQGDKAPDASGKCPAPSTPAVTTTTTP